MKKSLMFVALLVLAATACAQTDAQKALDTIKTLSGTWEGAASNGKLGHVTFKETGGGSAVMSEIVGNGEDMISMFHLDGANRLLLTHYCAVGNQPRMQGSVSTNGKVVTFDFMDATNLSSPDSGHMQRMVLTFIDPNHHTEEWVFADHGKEMKQVFDLKRKM